MKSELNLGLLLSLISFLFLSVVAFSTNTTGDSGDSVMHYLFSRYAPEHPHLFFHHWAKPVFVLLSSPFSQFGFKGIMMFNILCITLTMYFSYRIAEYLELKYAFEDPVFAAGAGLFEGTFILI
jgi:hypothetical protein